MEQECKELDGESIELWFFEIEGKKRLPAFSSQKRMTAFRCRMPRDLN